MGRKRKDPAGENVEAYRHETETRKNVVPAGLVSYDTLTSKPKKYEYDPHLNPQLVWAGEKEDTLSEEWLFKTYRRDSITL